ncbi:copper resistance CopC family protein [Terrabacter sp. Root181]|uniref:copper resistance CopC family protein n=1 Tax=Terrabacter sp. Root181 TaxID=1736484 RepID=UPI0006F4DA51|nr:copper resistance CopC family protein [Terrabacter sp. Root181]KRB43753.1 copper resistance protein CopC [Terrabacter sp. Root181]
MRRLASALLALGLLVALPTTAFAHDVLERTDPADGTTVAQLPGAVVLTFSEAPLEIGTQVVVTGPSGPVSSGSPTIEGRAVTQALAPNAPGGDYTVSYRVTSDDGHPVTGTFSFHATIGLDGSTATAGATVHVKPVSGADDAQGSLLVPILLTIVGTVVLLGVGGFLVLRGRGADSGA